METKLKNSTYDLYCTLHRYSYLIEGNINNSSIIQEMCLVFNTLFDLNFTLTYSLNKNHSNLIDDELPVINYGHLNVKKIHVYSFLKSLTGLREFKSDKRTEDIQVDEKEIKFHTEIMEKIILSDLQIALCFYNYFHKNEKTKYLWKFVKFCYQPFIMLRSTLGDRKIILEMTRQLGITTKYEALEYVAKILRKIEDFLNHMGDDYCLNLKEREINSIDILIYSAVKATNRIVSKNKRQHFGLNQFRLLEILCNKFDEIILNKIPIINKLDILQPDDLGSFKNRISSKDNFFTYSNYTEENILKIEDTRKLIRKSLFSFLYFGSLILLSLAINRQNE